MVTGLEQDLLLYDSVNGVPWEPLFRKRVIKVVIEQIQLFVLELSWQKSLSSTAEGRLCQGKVDWNRFLSPPPQRGHLALSPSRHAVANGDLDATALLC